MRIYIFFIPNTYIFHIFYIYSRSLPKVNCAKSICLNVSMRALILVTLELKTINLLLSRLSINYIIMFIYYFLLT